MLVPLARFHSRMLNKNLITHWVLLFNSNFNKVNVIIYILSTLWCIFRDGKYLIMSIELCYIHMYSHPE